MITGLCYSISNRWLANFISIVFRTCILSFLDFRVGSFLFLMNKSENTAEDSTYAYNEQRTKAYYAK